MKNKKFFKFEKTLFILLAILYIVVILSIVNVYDFGMIPMLLLPILPISFIIFVIEIIKYNVNTSIIKEKKLVKDSEEYQKYYDNKFKSLCSLLVWKIISFTYLAEGAYSIFICSCGFHYFKMTPCLIFSVFDVFVYFYGFKRMLKKDIKDKNNSFIIIAWTIISFVLYVLLLVLFRNNMDALHASYIRAA